MIGYVEGKPDDCPYCYWNFEDSHCSYENCGCNYALPERPGINQSVKGECESCPFRVYGPCIGWCTREILRSIRRGNRNGL